MVSKNGRAVLERRYLTRDVNGQLVESIEGMFQRVSDAVAAADAQYDGQADTAALSKSFYTAMTSLEFMPNSPTLMNAGRPLGQLSACFVLPVPDSMDGIFDAVKNAALIHKSGGGTGFSFSRLRSTGASVQSTGGVASGPISFMKVFNAATEAVKQGGTRRGANMGILRVDHPDIENFIRCKADDRDITNFNISVAITDAFMKAVKDGTEYDIIAPNTGKVVDRKNARAVFALIVEMAWRNGEPGIVFIDRMNAGNPVPGLGDIESTNPCGEQPLLPYESCNLGSINLEKMLREDCSDFDYQKLAQTVSLAVHFLDNVIDINRYPLPEIDETTKRTRKIGLGVMGWANALYLLKIPYDSDKALALARRVMGFIQAAARDASSKLALARGAFPAFEDSVLSKDEPVRNATTTTIAPTGTISIICDASSGIEPLFALAFTRNVMDNDALPDVNAVFEQAIRDAGVWSPELMRQIAREGTAAHIDALPEDIRRVFVTAHDISPDAHVRMQAAFQAHTDNAVSKTVNFPNTATREDVENVYLLAYELGLKGITIYRDGSRSMQVLTTGTSTEKKTDTPASAASAAPAVPASIKPRPRPEVTMGFTEKVRIGCGTLYITVNYDDKGICEVFANLGRAGGCPSQSEATSRLISQSLRAGMSAETIIEQLKGIRCLATLRKADKEIKVLSCPDAIGKVLEKVVAYTKKSGTALPLSPAVTEVKITNGTHCPECGAEVTHESGCVMCRTCGYSKCG